MSLSDQFLGQIGHHALGSAVEGWRDAFDQGGDLSDLHGLNDSASSRARASILPTPATSTVQPKTQQNARQRAASCACVAIPGLFKRTNDGNRADTETVSAPDCSRSDMRKIDDSRRLRNNRSDPIRSGRVIGATP